MSYLALARKWRPRTFAQMLGQEPVNKALSNTLTQQRLHHAYLFTGTRGVGKTSIARILAKALNCEQGINAEPCLTCDACTAIEQGRFIDLIEIDGASKTRVEDTRDLLENVHYAPSSGRYKIYLIDEVHMLSQHSFNALLKTLEEPPQHVKFFLATTDPQKIPVTVLSRCLQFHLKPLSATLISQHIQHILKQEQLDYEIKAVELLAYAARGSMRDGLSLLDQAITSCVDKLLENDVKLLLGYTQQDYALQLLQALAEQSPLKLLELNQQIVAEGEPFIYVLDELLNYLHQMTIYQHIGDKNPLVSPTESIKTLAKQFSAQDIQLFYQIAIKGREDLHLAPTLGIGFNMTMLRMLTFRPAAKIQQAPKQSAAVIEQATTTTTEEPIAINIPTAKADNAQWSDIIPKLKLTGMALNAIENTEFIAKENKHLNLRVATGHLSLFSPSTLKRIEEALSEYYQEPIKVALDSSEPVKASLAQKKNEAIQVKQKNAEKSLLNDSMFQQLKQDFSAELIKDSIVPLTDDL